MTTRMSTVPSLTMNDQAGEEWGVNGQSAVKVSIQAEVIASCRCVKKKQLPILIELVKEISAILMGQQA